MDLQWALYNASPQISLHHTPAPQQGDIDILVRSVRKCANDWLDNEIVSSVRLYLLHGRLEPFEDGPPRKIIFYFCHYLEVPNQKHRRALTRLLLADHPLAVEQLRRGSRYHPVVPRHSRLCRLCNGNIETPEHILLLCGASPALLDLRHKFLVSLQSQGIHTPVPTWSNAVSVLQGILCNRSSINLLAKFVYDALAVVEKTPLYRP